MTSESLAAFTAWLSQTPPSMLIQNVSWIVPSVQCVHITAIAVVMGVMVLLDFRLLGVAGRAQPIAVMANRLLPWMWWAILVLLISGAVLITGEPQRSLENPAFQLKMVMLIVAMFMTLGIQRGLRSDSSFWELTPSRRLAGKVVAVGTLTLFACIIFAGRWIAYFEVY